MLSFSAMPPVHPGRYPFLFTPSKYFLIHRQQTSPGKNTAGVDVEEVQVLIEKLEKILTARGPGGIIGLGKQFTVNNNFLDGAN